jgi:transcriptional regulator with PAS, ATPase and Fis domain
VMGGPRMETDHLSFHSLRATTPEPSLQAPQTGQTLKDRERQTLETVLRRHNQNRSAAARELGIARSTLLYKMNKHEIR